MHEGVETIIQQYLTTLFHDSAAPFDKVIDWRLIPDRLDKTNPAPVQKLRGSWNSLHQERLKPANITQGYGVHIVLHNTDGKGVRKQNIQSLNTVFMDSDGIKISELTQAIKTGFPPPSFMTYRSGTAIIDHWHAYYLLDKTDHTDFDTYGLIQKKLCQKFKTDSQCTALSKTLRVPGYYHLKKGKQSQYLFRKNEEDFRLYSLHDLYSALCGTSNYDDNAQAIALFRDSLSTYPIAIEDDGGDATTYQLACLGRDFGLSPARLLKEILPWNERCLPPWSESELKLKIKNAYEYAQNNVIGAKTKEILFLDADASPPANNDPTQIPWRVNGKGSKLPDDFNLLLVLKFDVKLDGLFAFYEHT